MHAGGALHERRGCQKSREWHILPQGTTTTRSHTPWTDHIIGTRQLRAMRGDQNVYRRQPLLPVCASCTALPLPILYDIQYLVDVDTINSKSFKW
jgi:hypothetical protein